MTLEEAACAGIAGNAGAGTASETGFLSSLRRALTRQGCGGPFAAGALTCCAHPGPPAVGDVPADASEVEDDPGTGLHWPFDDTDDDTDLEDGWEEGDDPLWLSPWPGKCGTVPPHARA